MHNCFSKMAKLPNNGVCILHDITRLSMTAVARNFGSFWYFFKFFKELVFIDPPMHIYDFITI